MPPKPKAIKCIMSETACVGKRIKKSKIRFTWQFELENSNHKIDLFVSKLSGKRKILMNGEMRFNKKVSGLFNHTFNVGNHLLSVIQFEGGYDLRIDNQSFMALSKRQGGGNLDLNWGSQDPKTNSWVEFPGKADPYSEQDSWSTGQRQKEAIFSDWEQEGDIVPAKPSKQEPKTPTKPIIAEKQATNPSQGRVDLISEISPSAKPQVEVDAFGFTIQRPQTPPEGVADLYGLAPLPAKPTPPPAPQVAYATQPEFNQAYPNPYVQQQAMMQAMYNQFMTGTMPPPQQPPR